MHAENASTEQLREMWARILAGEITQLGSFSKATLRVVSELEANIARTFQEVCCLAVSQEFLVRPADLRGQTLLNFSGLEQAGLLHEVNGMLRDSWTRNEDGYFYRTIGDYGLRVKATKVHLPIILLTQVGRELLQIIPRESDRKIAEHVADALESNSDEIVLFRRKYDVGHKDEFEQVEVLKETN